MIDIHCHILHAVDDGAKTIYESIEMAKMAAKDGVRKIVATPHIDDQAISFEEIRQRVEALNDKLIDMFVPVEVLPGAEAVSGMPPDMMEKYTINDNGYILIEFPHSHLPCHAEEMIGNIISRGMKPVIAHPERNPTIIKKPEILVDIVERTGAGVQVTANSLTGSFGRKVRSCALYLLKKRIVHIIGSDAHSVRSRPPGLLRALKTAGKILGRNQVQKLVYDNPEAVVNGGKLI